MWCAASDCGRHLAVNNGVRCQISDSGAIRSVAVPNVKITRGSVAFWHNARVSALSGEACLGFDPGGTGSCQENASNQNRAPRSDSIGTETHQAGCAKAHIALERGSRHPTTVASTMPPVLS